MYYNCFWTKTWHGAGASLSSMMWVTIKRVVFLKEPANFKPLVASCYRTFIWDDPMQSPNPNSTWPMLGAVKSNKHIHPTRIHWHSDFPAASMSRLLLGATVVSPPTAQQHLRSQTVKRSRISRACCPSSENFPSKPHTQKIQEAYVETNNGMYCNPMGLYRFCFSSMQLPMSVLVSTSCQRMYGQIRCIMVHEIWRCFYKATKLQENCQIKGPLSVSESRCGIKIPDPRYIAAFLIIISVTTP